jgi:hypothetical protein
MSSRRREATVGIFFPYLVKRFGEKIPTRPAAVRDDRRYGCTRVLGRVFISASISASSRGAGLIRSSPCDVIT